VTPRGLRVTEDNVPSLASDGCHPGTDVAGLGGFVDVLNLENVVGRHSRPPWLGRESPNWGQRAQGPFESWRRVSRVGSPGPTTR
jgi:hypothetical protein